MRGVENKHPKRGTDDVQKPRRFLTLKLEFRTGNITAILRNNENTGRNECFVSAKPAGILFFHFLTHQSGPQKRIVVFFVAYRGCSAVSADNLSGLRQYQQLACDIADQIRVVAARKIRSTDTFIKQDISRY